MMQDQQKSAYPKRTTGHQICRALFDFRTRVQVLGATACLLGAWMTCVEYLHTLPNSFGVFSLGLPNASRTSLAAQLGVWRADLWAEDALIQSHWEFDTSSVPDAKYIDEAQQAARRSLTLAPLNTKMWLILAARASRSSEKLDITTPIEMAYLTDPWDPKLFPARFSVVAKSNALRSKTIQDLVKADLEKVVTQAPDLEPTLLQIYRQSSENSAMLHAIIGSVDPNLLGSSN